MVIINSVKSMCDPNLFIIHVPISSVVEPASFFYLLFFFLGSKARQEHNLGVGSEKNACKVQKKIVIFAIFILKSSIFFVNLTQ